MYQKDFIAALAFVSHAMAKNDVRYFLQGVCFDVAPQDNGRQLTMIGTDGARLAAIEASGPIELPVGQYILESDLVNDALKAFKVNKKAPGDEPISIEITEGMDVQLSASGKTVTGKLIDGKFPDWRRVMEMSTREPDTASFSFNVGVNACYLAEFGKAVKHISPSKFPGMQIRVIDDKSALSITVPVSHEYDLQNARGLIMPMKL